VSPQRFNLRLMSNNNFIQIPYSEHVETIPISGFVQNIVFPCVSTDFKTILALRLSLFELVSICICQPCQRCLFRLEMSDFGVLRHQTATFSYFQLLTYSYLLHALSLLRLLSFLHAIILSYFVDLVGRPRLTRSEGIETKQKKCRRHRGKYRFTSFSLAESSRPWRHPCLRSI